MANYRISGVWKNSNNIITHYAFHKIGKESTSRAEKTSKVDAIKILEMYGNSAKTWVWNYKKAFWDIGEDVHIVEGKNGKYLRSDPDNTLTDNLNHLIDFDWIKS